MGYSDGGAHGVVLQHDHVSRKAVLVGSRVPGVRRSIEIHPPKDYGLHAPQMHPLVGDILAAYAQSPSYNHLYCI